MTTNAFSTTSPSFLPPHQAIGSEGTNNGTNTATFVGIGGGGVAAGVAAAIAYRHFCSHRNRRRVAPEDNPGFVYRAGQENDGQGRGI